MDIAATTIGNLIETATAAATTSEKQLQKQERIQKNNFIEIAIIKRNYNDMSQVINYSKSWGGTDKHVVEYFYDNEGNNIKQLEYTVNNSDTTDVEVWNWVMYKGYRIESDKIERFIVDREFKEAAGKRAREFVLERFSVGKMVADTLAQYEEILA